MSPPDLLTLIGEVGALGEWAVFPVSLPLLYAKAPRGDEHPVLVMPGFMAEDTSTIPLRGFLSTLGYKTEAWGLGLNRGPDHRMPDKLLDLLDRTYDKYGEPVSLVGWSMGGLYARYLAHKRPDKVRQIIMMGSGFRHSEHTHATPLVKWFSEFIDVELVRLIDQPVPVPSTSIYSRSDGIVDWRCCLQDEGELAENIEVFGWHLGLGVRPTTLWLVAERLAQAKGEWKKFVPDGMGEWVYRLGPAAAPADGVIG